MEEKETTKIEEAANPTGLITILQTINSLLLLVNETVTAIEYLKNGDPDKVDVAKLKKMLMELPNLPETK